MPVNTHLEFQEITDFTPGYFSVGGFLMPANASQEMEDCRPDPGGGIRASAKPNSFSTSGIPSTAKVVGMYSRGGIALQGGGGEGSDRYLAVFDSADNKVKIYRWNETPSSPATSWSLIKAHAAVNGPPNPVQFDTFVGSSGQIYVVWTLAHTSADDGLWYLRFSYQTGQGASAADPITGGSATYSVTQAISGFVTAVGVQDDRLIVASGTYASTLKWCASQDLTSWPAANYITVQASRQGSIIMSITPFAPGDLLIGTRYSAWTQVQGAITDPTVRTMSDARTLGGGQKAAFTNNGLAFISPRTGVFYTGTGDSFTDASQQISPAIWTQANSGNGADVGDGDVVYGGNFLLAPHGLFRDDRTNAWFRSSVLDSGSDHWHSWYDGANRRFFAATGGNNFSLWTFDVDENTRCESYTWKSAPMRRPERNIRIREVQIVTRVYHASSTFTITVGSTSYAVTPGVTGRQTIRFLCDEWAEMLDVKVVAASNASGYEAPAIEAVRVGSMDDHQTIQYV